MLSKNRITVPYIQQIFDNLSIHLITYNCHLTNGLTLKENQCVFFSQKTPEEKYVYKVDIKTVNKRH